ncbi:hypothetical protein L2E82_51194 [Cichorium intybus]|nr:hypothetical protein L2E82_51194 [Cichorium intybus]
MGTQKHQRPHGLNLKIEITTKFEGLGITISSPTRNDRENCEDVNGNGKADMAERRHLASASTALFLAVGIGIFDGLALYFGSGVSTSTSIRSIENGLTSQVAAIKLTKPQPTFKTPTRQPHRISEMTSEVNLERRDREKQLNQLQSLLREKEQEVVDVKEKEKQLEEQLPKGTKNEEENIVLVYDELDANLQGFQDDVEVEVRSNPSFSVSVGYALDVSLEMKASVDSFSRAIKWEELWRLLVKACF